MAGGRFFDTTATMLTSDDGLGHPTEHDRRWLRPTFGAEFLHKTCSLVLGWLIAVYPLRTIFGVKRDCS